MAELKHMNKDYKTFAEQFYLQESGFLQRRRREYRLLLWLLQNIVNWAKSRKVRAEFQRCRASDQPFYVDRFAAPPSKK